MEELAAYTPWLLAMVMLIGFSGFFSSSEAALFSLTLQERRRLEKGNQSQRTAAELLLAPDRLLTAVLFWNLIINVAYFSITSIITLSLESQQDGALAWFFSMAALLVIIIFGEMLPKSLAVTRPRWLASVIGFPLALSVRIVQPFFPTFRLLNVLSLRLIWPKFTAESYLSSDDLERAVERSTSDAALLQQEQRVLHHVLDLSDIRLEELMQPRARLVVHRPPISLEDIEREIPTGGYVLVTEEDSEEIAAAIPLFRLSHWPETNLEQYAEPVIYLPWCASSASVLDAMLEQQRWVVVAVNEFGETIGILTFEDLLDTVIGESPSRSARLLKRAPISQTGPRTWLVTGMTNLRRIEEYFELEEVEAKSNTVSGLVQELLGRLPETGDTCQWGDFDLTVLDIGPRGGLVVEFVRQPQEEPEP